MSESKPLVLVVSFYVKETDVDKATSPSGHGPAVSRGLKGFTEGKQLFDFPEIMLKSPAMSHTPSAVRLPPGNPLTLFQYLKNLKKTTTKELHLNLFCKPATTVGRPDF